MDDSRIIDLFFERSEQAIGELEKKYGSTVRRITANILPDKRDAEECASDAYLGVWNSIPPRRPDPLVSYVCRIARNLAISRLRANTAARRNSGYDLALDELGECIPAGSDVENELESRELTAAIDRFLGELDYDDRFLFVRRYWYGDTVTDIADQAGARPNQVSVRLFRLREKLRKTLIKEGLTI